MPVSYRMINFNFEPSEAGHEPYSVQGAWGRWIRVPLHILTISGSKSEAADIEKEMWIFGSLDKAARIFAIPSNMEQLEGVLASLIFAGYLNVSGRGDVTDWVFKERENLPAKDYPEIYDECVFFAKAMIEQPAFPVAGSVPAEVVRLIEALRKAKVFGLTGVILGSSLALGQPLSPFLVIEVSIAGTTSFFIISTGTAAADWIASYIRKIGGNSR